MVNHEPLTPRQAQTLQIIRKHQPIRRRDIAARLGCADKTAQAHLDYLRRHGLISATGRGVGSAGWVIGDGLPDSSARLYIRAPSVWAYADRCGGRA